MSAQEKIAIITDSGADVPAEIAEKFHILTAPLLIEYKAGTFKDRVTITPDEIYARFEEEIPKTSLPQPSDMTALFEQVIAEGCTHVICATISSGLSGTHNAMSLVAKEFPQLTVAMIDTKNIGIGAGLSVIYAAELREQGLPFAEIIAKTEKIVSKTHLYFCVNTLEYLYAGGRIGLATYKLGTILNLRPVITCNSEGVYVTVAKARGRKASLRKAVELTQKDAAGSKRYRVAVAHGDALMEAEEIAAHAQIDFPYNIEPVRVGQVSPALVVHTGPGLIGIGVQVLD